MCVLPEHYRLFFAVRVKPSVPEGPSPPPLPRVEKKGTDARLEPTGLLKPRQKPVDFLTGPEGADRSARMHA
jgi:hypothetical protein